MRFKNNKTSVNIKKAKVEPSKVDLVIYPEEVEGYVGDEDSDDEDFDYYIDEGGENED